MNLKDRSSVIASYWVLWAGLLFLPQTSTWAQTIAATVTVGSGPGAVAVNTVTDKIYVANAGSRSVTVIDGTTNSTTTVQVGGNPMALAINEATNKIYAVYHAPLWTGGQGGVTVIDGDTGSTTTVIDSNARVPWAVAVNPVTNKIYIANFLSSNVTVIDGATNTTTTLSDPNAIGLDAYAVALNPVTNKIYVANNNIDRAGTNPGNISVIDGATNSTTTVTDPNAISPVDIAVNQATNKIYVANFGGGPSSSNPGNVTVIDGAMNSAVTVTDPNANEPGGPDSRGFAVAVDSATNKIYVVNEGSHNVTVIDGATNSTATVTDPNALAPVAVAVDSATNTIYVANGGCLFLSSCNNVGSVTVINGATNSATTIIDPNANTPNAVAINAMTNKIYVTNLLSGNATVIDGGATPTTHTLSVLLAGGDGTVTSNPTGIDCRKFLGKLVSRQCSASFTTGTIVILTASALDGYQVSWGTACTGISTCDVLMTSDEFVTATFARADFSLQPASAALTAQRGSQITDVITIAPLIGSSFGSAIQLSCAVTGTTPMPTCALSPSSVTPGANPIASTLTITAPALSAAMMPSSDRQFSCSLFAVCLPLLGLALLAFLKSGETKSRRRIQWLLCSLALALVALQVGCGGGGSTGGGSSGQQNYAVTVTATSGAIQHATQVTVVVP